MGNSNCKCDEDKKQRQLEICAKRERLIHEQRTANQQMGATNKLEIARSSIQCHHRLNKQNEQLAQELVQVNGMLGAERAANEKMEAEQANAELSGKFVLMPLELHCELFSWLPLFSQRRMIPELCRSIYAAKRTEVKRKLQVSQATA